MKRCIVNVFSEGRENYVAGTKRLINSLKDVGYIGDILVWSPLIKDYIVSAFLPQNITLHQYEGWGCNEKYGECKPHKEANYQFKSYTMQFAREQGYDQVMWCDSSTIFLKNPQMYFDLVEEIGVLTFDVPNSIEAEWTADITLKAMGCDIDFAKAMTQCYGGLYAFDFRHDVANIVFDEYIQYASNIDVLNGIGGSTRPEFKEHRHDMSILSFLIRKNKLYNLSFGSYVWSGFNHNYSTAISKGM